MVTFAKVMCWLTLLSGPAFWVLGILKATSDVDKVKGGVLLFNLIEAFFLGLGIIFKAIVVLQILGSAELSFWSILALLIALAPVNRTIPILLDIAIICSFGSELPSIVMLSITIFVLLLHIAALGLPKFLQDSNGKSSADVVVEQNDESK